MHLIHSRGLALITRTHGGTLPEKRHLLPVRCDSLALAMCCLFVRERARLRNRKRGPGENRRDGLYRKHKHRTESKHECAARERERKKKGSTDIVTVRGGVGERGVCCHNTADLLLLLLLFLFGLRFCGGNLKRAERGCSLHESCQG